jgi:hypothetical protein
MKNSKIIFLLFAFLLSLCSAYAQQSRKDEGKERLALAIWIPDNTEGMPDAVRDNLYNKVAQIISKQGIAADPAQSRFIITAKVVIQEKYITPTAPPKQGYKLDVTFYIGDGFEGKVFASHTTSAKGVGDNETKAYMNALKSVNVNDPAYAKFVEQGKSKIVEYFNSHCDVIIKDAKTLAGMQKFEEALWKLTSVPDVCTDCWNKSMDVAAGIFQQKIDYECKYLLSEATNAWNAGQNWDAAENTGIILAQINPDSKCFNDAAALSEKIALRIKEVDQREWDFKYEKEIGLIKTAMDIEKERAEKAMDLEKERINAYREVGVAWANNQPDIVYKSLY